MDESRYVSRAGLKLEHALRAFEVDVAGLDCADLGCNVGGFTDCLLSHGAAKVTAVDTGYGTLAWNLRSDPRVVAMERTNALHLDEVLPDGTMFDLITIDLGWTRQGKALPAALPLLRPGGGRIISLLKPHYEATEAEKSAHMAAGALSDDGAAAVCRRVLGELHSFGAEVLAHTTSPIRGGKSSRKAAHRGNIEYLLLLRPAGARI